MTKRVSPSTGGYAAAVLDADRRKADQKHSSTSSRRVSSASAGSDSRTDYVILWLVSEFLVYDLPPVDFAHYDLTRGEQRPAHEGGQEKWTLSGER